MQNNINDLNKLLTSPQFVTLVKDFVSSAVQANQTNNQISNESINESLIESSNESAQEANTQLVTIYENNANQQIRNYKR